MENFTVKTLRLLTETLGNASYYVSNGMTEKMGYTISEERATYLIARSLDRQLTINFLIDICVFIENEENLAYAERVKSLLSGGDLDET